MIYDEAIAALNRTDCKEVEEKLYILKNRNDISENKTLDGTTILSQFSNKYLNWIKSFGAFSVKLKNFLNSSKLKFSSTLNSKLSLVGYGNSKLCSNDSTESNLAYGDHKTNFPFLFIAKVANETESMS